MKVWYLIVFSANFQGEVSKFNLRFLEGSEETRPKFRRVQVLHILINYIQLTYFGSLKLLEHTHL